MAAKKKKKDDNILVRNRKAFHDYAIIEKLEAGIELKGTEVKSCRARTISVVDSYVNIKDGEAWLVNVHIAGYDFGNRFNHDTRRMRRLLLHKKQILKLQQQIREKRYTVVPLKFYLVNSKVKVELGIAKGKTTFDKRESLKRQQHNLEARAEISKYK